MTDKPRHAGEFLLEVRAEEIPARMLPGAVQELGTGLFEELMRRGLVPAEVDQRLHATSAGVGAERPSREGEGPASDRGGPAGRRRIRRGGQSDARGAGLREEVRNGGFVP